MSRIDAARVITIATDGVLWVLAGIGVKYNWDSRDMDADLTAAGAMLVIAAMCWLGTELRERSDKRYQALAAEYGRREALLIRTFASLAEAPRDPTGPLPRLRSVPGPRR